MTYCPFSRNIMKVFLQTKINSDDFILAISRHMEYMLALTVSTGPETVPLADSVEVAQGLGTHVPDL